MAGKLVNTKIVLRDRGPILSAHVCVRWGIRGDYQPVAEYCGPNARNYAEKFVQGFRKATIMAGECPSNDLIVNQTAEAYARATRGE